MINKRLMVVGASILQVPAIKKAKEMGLTVGVVDYNPNAVGIQYADKYFNCSTLDKDGVNKAVKEFAADGIMTMATDMPAHNSLRLQGKQACGHIGGMCVKLYR